jgi:hypothetical protein
MKEIVYWFRGQIEKGSNYKCYKWADGYSAKSENGMVLYPWMTKKECRQDAKEQGCKAVFKEER